MEKRVIELSKRNSEKFSKFDTKSLQEMEKEGMMLEFEDGIAKRIIIEW